MGPDSLTLHSGWCCGTHSQGGRLCAPAPAGPGPPYAPAAPQPPPKKTPLVKNVLFLSAIQAR